MAETVYVAEAFDEYGDRVECIVHATRDGVDHEVETGESFVEADRVEVTETKLYGGPMGPVETVEKGDPLIDALEASDCHPDLVTYVRKARELGGTPILRSLERSHEHSGVEKMSRVGTRIEQTLWNEGAQATLEQCGNLDATNTDICEAIVAERHGEQSTGVEAL